MKFFRNQYKQFPRDESLAILRILGTGKWKLKFVFHKCARKPKVLSVWMDVVQKKKLTFNSTSNILASLSK